jgi:hypothetical protein
MAQDLLDHYDELIPYAADRSAQFLGVIKQRTEEEGLPLQLNAKSERRSNRVVLEGLVQVGRGLNKGRPTTITVFADPVGNSLQVGWQISTPGVPAVMMGFDSVAMAQASMDRKDARPENVRAMSGVLMAFQQVVFVPVVGLLVDAVQRARGSQDRGGFLGA